MKTCDIVLISVGGQGIVTLVCLATLARRSASCSEKDHPTPILLLARKGWSHEDM